MTPGSESATAKYERTWIVPNPILMILKILFSKVRSTSQATYQTEIIKKRKVGRKT